MKNTFKTFGIIAIVAIIGFSMVTCDLFDKDDNNNDNNNNNNNKPTVTTQDPTAYDFNISGTGTVYFDKNYKTVTVTPKASKTSGARTIYYEGTNKEEYPKTTNEPLFFGTYNVTFDVEAATGWNAASGLSAGTLTIADGTPTAPTGVTLAIASTTSIKVSWTTVPRATSYKVYYIKEGMQELSLAGTVTTNSFTHSGLSLKLDDIYFYYITANNTYGVSDYSTFKSILIAKPVAPNAVTATATSSTGISLQWSAVTGATGYKVRYNITNSSSGGAILPDTYTSTSTPLTGAQANTTYYFWVKAINPFGESDYSTVTASATTFRESNITLGLRLTGDPLVFSSGKASIQLTWNRVNTSGNSSISSYYVYRSDGTPNNFKEIDSTPVWVYDSSITTNSLVANTTYYFYISFRYYANYYDYEGTEYMSEIIMVRTGSAPPPPPPTPPPPLPPAASTPPTSTVICSRCDGARVCGNCVLGMYETKYGFIICPICKGNNKCIRCNGLGKY